tara:strand:- start:236 stop:568 length:333 start_codon:yes stop_codon:yes gene_type:complete
MDNKIDVPLINKYKKMDEINNISLITSKINIIEINDNKGLNDKDLNDNNSGNMNEYKINSIKLENNDNNEKENNITSIDQDKTSFKYRELYCKRKLNKTGFDSILRKKKK